MHSLLISVYTLAVLQPTTLAAWAPLVIWDKVWPYLLMLAGFSLIVFVHELGHFIVAKWAGVRVERFAVGFGRELIGFTRGETRYSFNVLPLGGYVKMLGQEDFDDKANELKFKSDPRSFVNKPVGHRMAIVSAGVVMNIIFACLLFMAVFMIGMDAAAPRIAMVEPDSPADKAGLLPGDILHEINGDRILEFNEVRYAVMLAEPHEPIEFVVKRDGVIQPPIYITPEYRAPESTRGMKRQIIGIAPGRTREILAVGPEIDVNRPDHPHIGDVLVQVGEIAATDDNASEIFDALVYTDGDIFVERPDPRNPNAPPERVRIEVPPLLSLYPGERGDAQTTSVLGLTPLARFALVEGKSRAELAGIKVGDTVLRWDDKPHPSMADIALSVMDNAERDIPFQVMRANGKTFSGFVRPKRHKGGSATIQAVCKSVADPTTSGSSARARFAEVRPGGIAARAGIEPGDLIVKLQDLEYPTKTAANRVIRKAVDKRLSVTVQKADGRPLSTYVRPQAPGSIDAIFSLVADDLLQVGESVPTIRGRPTPAAEAGIPAGAKITAVSGTPVTRWRELIAAFRRNAGTTVDLAYVDGAGQAHVAQFPVPHSLRTLLGVGPEARIQKIDGRDTVSVQRGEETETLSVRYREGTRTILTELIGQESVPVEYRKNPFSELQTAYIDVTADMVDPWLGRVVFSPSVQSGSETVLLRGENMLDAVWIGVHKTYYFILQVYTIMERMIFTRSLGVEGVSGPLGIFDMGGQVARADLVKFLFFMAMISANLAVINFLPLPIVDGGLMIFLIIEKIKGCPVSLRVQVATQMIGLFLIIGLFLFVTYQDVLRLSG